MSVFVTRILYSEVFLNLTVVFLTLTEVFPCLFLSCKANARVKLAKMGHGPHSSTLVICVVRLLCVSFYVLFVRNYPDWGWLPWLRFDYPDWGFSVPLPQLLGKCQGKTRKDGARPPLFLVVVLFYVFLCSLYCLFCDVPCIVCVYMCTEQLSPGGYPIAVKYIISNVYCHRVTTQLQLINIPYQI